MKTASSIGLVLVLCLSAHAGEDEKLLFGFEKEECEKAASDAKTKNTLQIAEDGRILLKPPQGCQFPHVIAGINPMECVQAEASQGKYSLKVPNSAAASAKPHFLYVNPREVLSELLAEPRANLRLPEVFNTHDWYKRIFPEDWSGWDCLRVDVKVTFDRPATILVEVEDDLVEPPVSQTYEGVKPNEWMTLELDLRKAMEERKLDPSKMRNIFVRFDGRKDLALMTGKDRPNEILAKLAVYVDNIRLAKRGAPCKTPVLQGERSVYTRTLPRAYAVDLVWRAGEIEATAAPDPKWKPVKPTAKGSGETPTPPMVVEILPLLQKGFEAKASKNLTAENLHHAVELQTVTAANGDAVLVAFAMPLAVFSMKLDQPVPTKFGPVAAVVTTDGGKTWGGFGGPGTVPSWLCKGRKTWEGTVFDAGADVMALFDEGCLTFRTALEFYPGDRVYLWRTVYTGKGWKMSSRLFVSGDPRWCSHAAQNVLQLSSGRIWCMFSSRGRNGMEVSAKYSDDEGFTWRSWRGDGLVATIPGLPGKDLRGELFPHGEHVGMLMPKGKWIVFDGKEWTGQPACPVKTPVQVVACGKDVFVVDRDGVLVEYDGTAWKTLALPGREDYPRAYVSRNQSPGATEWTTRQYFTVCGETTLFVEVDKTGKKILCWRRTKGGAWSGPRGVVVEETPIADLVAPRYSQAGFVPVAYNCWNNDTKSNNGGEWYQLRRLKPWIKVLKVSAQ